MAHLHRATLVADERKRKKGRKARPEQLDRCLAEEEGEFVHEDGGLESERVGSGQGEVEEGRRAGTEWEA